MKGSNFLFTPTNTDLHAERETKLENIACDSLCTDTPFNAVKELLDKEFRARGAQKVPLNFSSSR